VLHHPRDVDWAMFIFLLRLRPLAHQRQEVLDILRCVEGPISAQAGCLSCGSYRGVGDDSTVLYLEQWTTAGAIHQHIQSALFSKILIAMDLSVEQPKIGFYEVAREQGLELVEALRGAWGNR
jgi:quinol monooxygenase YgiN